MSRTVAVALPVGLRREFDYLAPENLHGAVLPGSRVRVPFGERLLSGVIVGVADSESARDVRPLRSVAEVLDDEPALSMELLESTRRIAERFFVPWGELLRAALPAQLPQASRSRYALTAAGALQAGRAPETEREVLDLLLNRGPLSRRDLPRGAAVLRSLEDRGLIRVAGESARPRSERTEKIYRSIIGTGDSDAPLGRSARARSCLSFLRSLDRAASASELRRAGFTAAVLRKLQEVGFVSVSEESGRDDEPVSRHPRRDELQLSSAQGDALGEISRAIESREFSALLIWGVTGSGKTEIYLRAIAAARAAQKGAVWLVPEIALTPVFARHLSERFGDDAVVFHSSLSERDRGRAWERVRSGQSRIVIGPRSAVFAPVDNIGLFIIDEEHDSSYKQDESPRYDARDAAAIRGRALGATLVLGSATPSAETFFSAGRSIRLLRIPERVERRPLPAVAVVDLRRETSLPEEKGRSLFSRALVGRLHEVFTRGEQAILLVPRRGYSPFLLCRDCGEDFRCSSCSIARVVHRRPPSLLCHYCGSRTNVPRRCPRCASEILDPIGAGTERVAERFAEIFPGVRFAVLDADTARRKGHAAALVSSMESGNIQALLGTQMVAKGHHFPSVTAIGVLAIDTVLNLPDFRSSERAFQLLSQVSGRAGRGDRPGTVHVQTFNPDHPAIRAVVSHDTEGFLREELRFRETFFYPPFAEMAEVLVSSERREAAEGYSGELAPKLAAFADVVISGPSPAAIERLRGRWRYQILLRSRSRRRILEALNGAIPDSPPASVTIGVDVDPRNLM